MKTILFPTDFSKNADHAFRYAKMMARAKNAKLVLMYVYNLPLVAPANAFTTREQTLTIIDKDLRNAAHEHMKRYTKELELTDEPHEVFITEGNTLDHISSFCIKEDVDLVIMGTKGETNNRDFLMGSLTAKLIEKINTPILAIPESALILPFKKIVFATDLIYNSTDEIQKTIDFAKMYNSSLTFLHIETDVTKREEMNDLQKIIEQDKDQLLELKVVQDTTVTHGIDSYLKENEPDLLILSNHTKSFFEKLFHKSVSKKMVLHSKTPLLVFSKEIHPMVFF